MTPHGFMRGRTVAGAGVALGVALLLRLLQLHHGLPDMLEEAWPFREAWDMWGWSSGHADLNPHRFHYPSLTFYLHFALQQAQFLLGRMTGAYANPADYYLVFRTDPTAMVVLARLLAAVADVAGIAAVIWMGERIRPLAGIAAGLALAVSPTLIGAVRAIVPDTYMAALAMAALAAMLQYLNDGRRRTLVLAVVLIGLATGAKYPGATLLLPLALTLAMRDARRAPLHWAVSAAGAFAVFIVTTPYALFDFRSFWRDLGFVRQLPGAGHLGRLAGTGVAFDFDNLVRNVGFLGLALLAASLLFLLQRPRERRADAVLWLALLGFALPVFTARVEAARYLVPVIPLAVLLALIVLLRLLDRFRERQRFAAGIAALFVFLLSPTIGWMRLAMAGGRSTQIVAREWFEAHADDSKIIVQEAYGAPLLTRIESAELRGSSLFQEASPRARGRYEARRAWRAVQLPLTTVGPGTVTLPDSAGGEVTIPIARHSVDFNHLSYDPRLFAGVDYVVTTNAVRSRFTSDSTRFAPETRFYRLLDRTADVAAAILPQPRITGPEITIYRATPAFRESVAAYGTLDPLWWLQAIPLESRRAIEARVVPAALRTDGALRAADGRPAAWALVLERMYETLVRPFAHPLSAYLVELGRMAPARPLAAATLEMSPADVQACLVYAAASGAVGDWRAARMAVERTQAALAPYAASPPQLRLAHAEALYHTGDIARAQVTLQSVASGDDAFAARARDLLDGMK